MMSRAARETGQASPGNSGSRALIIPRRKSGVGLHSAAGGSRQVKLSQRPTPTAPLARLHRPELARSACLTDCPARARGAAGMGDGEAAFPGPPAQGECPPAAPDGPPPASLGRLRCSLPARGCGRAASLSGSAGGASPVHVPLPRGAGVCVGAGHSLPPPSGGLARVVCRAASRGWGRTSAAAARELVGV